MTISRASSTPGVPAGASALTLTVGRLAWLGPGEDKTHLVESEATAGHWDWTIAVGGSRRSAV